MKQPIFTTIKHKTTPLATIVLLLLLTTAACNKSSNEQQTVSSPDGAITFELSVDQGQLRYAATYNGESIFLPSKLGLKFKALDMLGAKMKITGTEYQSYNATWEQPWGEKRLIENRYEEMLVKLQGYNGNTMKMDIRVKVYNDGFGFRYEIPEQENTAELIIMDEVTEFKLTVDEEAWWTPIYTENYYEAVTRQSPISQMDTANLPLTIECRNGTYLAIHEANLTEYAAMNLFPKDSSTLSCDLTPWSSGEKVFTQAPFVSPWRAVTIAQHPGNLITSYLALNLNEPCKIEDTSWIEPGKYIGIWWGMHMNKYTWHTGPKHGATTRNTMRHIDFAAKHGFSGVLVEGWNYGWENDWTSEGDLFSFTRSYPDFDIEKITDYAREKGVRLIGHHETGGATINYEKQMEDAFALYHDLGVNAIKTGYVSPLLDAKERHSSQYGVRHFRKVIETAAKYHIMIDNHEPVMPTGLRRTYPNLMTQEGVRGQEYNAWSGDGGNKPDHLTIIPFTRGLAGPIDFTPGIFNFENPVNPGTRVQTTLAKQLALYVVLYSPLQMAADLPENYEGHPALKFIEDVPVNWDVTKVVDGEIGDYITTVRKDRHSDEWYMGSITDENSRIIAVDLDFLDKNMNYMAEIYRDGTDADWKNNPTALTIERKTVQSTEQLQFKLATSGGVAIRFVPQK